MKKQILFTFTFLFFIKITTAQVVITSENFDATTTPTFPLGWDTTCNFQFHWKLDSSNFSITYIGASGLKNLAIKNSDTSGIYRLVSPIYSTLGYNTISLSYGARNTSTFPTSGSTIGLEYSIDSNLTWTALPYTENAANSVWALINGGVPVTLPANASNQTHLSFRWTANIVSTGPLTTGTYRIDDFNLLGNPSGVNIYDAANTPQLNIMPNPVNGNCTVKIDGLKNVASLRVIDVTGNIVFTQNVNGNPTQLILNTDNLSEGIYYLQINSATNIATKKLVVIK